MYILGFEFALQLFYLFGFLLQFVAQPFDCLLQFIGVERACLELLFQFGNAFAVHLHGAADEGNALHYVVLGRFFAFAAFDVHAPFGFVYLAEALLYVVERAQDVVQLIVFLVYYSD